MHRTRALYGDVILRGSLPAWIITALLCALVIGALAFAVCVHIDGQPAYRWLLAQVRG